MAQAEAIPTTSRRNFLACGAVAAVAGMPVITLAASPTEPVSEELRLLGAELKRAHDVWFEKGDELQDCVDKLKAWDSAHPEPESYDENGDRNPDFGRLIQERLDERHLAAKEFGKFKALDAHATASREYKSKLSDVMCFTARSMADLLYKAELSWWHDNDEAYIATSVAVGLLEMMRPELVA